MMKKRRIHRVSCSHYIKHMASRGSSAPSVLSHKLIHYKPQNSWLRVILLVDSCDCERRKYKAVMGRSDVTVAFQDYGDTV